MIDFSNLVDTVVDTTQSHCGSCSVRHNDNRNTALKISSSKELLLSYTLTDILSSTSAMRWIQRHNNLRAECANRSPLLALVK